MDAVHNQTKGDGVDASPLKSSVGVATLRRTIPSLPTCESWLMISATLTSSVSRMTLSGSDSQLIERSRFAGGRFRRSVAFGITRLLWSTTRSLPATARILRFPNGTSAAARRTPGSSARLRRTKETEFERTLIRERTQAGLQAARARGRQGERSMNELTGNGVGVPGSTHRYRPSLLETGPVESEQHSLLLGVAWPASGGAARRLRGEDIRPPLALAPSHLSLKFVVVDHCGHASRSTLQRASASSGIPAVRSRT